MKLLPGLFLLATSAIAQGPVAGTWTGNATVHGQQVPVRLEISGSGNDLHAALHNGPESSPASSAVFTGNHLALTFNYYAKTLDATLADGKLTGSFGTAATRYPVSLDKSHNDLVHDHSPILPSINGDWEIAVKSAKGESAWQLRVEPGKNASEIKAVIQRIDGDTGSLYGFQVGESYRISHFIAAGPALYSLTPQADGTLLVSNLAAGGCERSAEPCGAASGAGACGEACGAYRSYATDHGERSFCAVQIQLSGSERKGGFEH